jgi:pSer/pThr/pTyr-binding forkhead associated (FHA) protein
MQLRLVLKGPERLTAGIRERSVETGVLVIGRSADADWVLSDPERIVSKRHCRIERQGGGFFLTDLSTNGVLVNGVPLGRESSRMLVDGDMLTLGDAIIGVAIDTQAPIAEERERGAVSLSGADGAFVDGPFADGPFGFDEMAAEAVKNAILPETVPQAEGGRVAVLQDWWIPDATGARADPKPVDISGGMGDGMGNASIAHTNATGEAVGSTTDRETNLVLKAVGLDVAVFARAVEAAMSVLSVDEKRKFEGRLHELLRKEKSG